MSLLHLHGDKCNWPGCGRNYVFQRTYVGTCLVVSWRCSAGHIGGRWASQPTCDKLRAGNLLLASSILLSGNSFTKVGLLFKFLYLQYFSSTFFYWYQNLYIAPAVDDYWKSMQKDLWQERAGNNVILSGDGRNDSPGHSAQYCTHTLADMETKTILQLEIVDEKAGFHMIADRNKVYNRLRSYGKYFCDLLRSCDRDRRRSQKIEPCSI